MFYKTCRKGYLHKIKRLRSFVMHRVCLCRWCHDDVVDIGVGWQCGGEIYDSRHIAAG